MMDPIAYVYDADEHCPDCTFKRFGHTWRVRDADRILSGEHLLFKDYVKAMDYADAHGFPIYGPFIAEGDKDSEGNEVGAVFDAFEDRDMVCGTCGELIHEVEKRFVVTFPATVSIAVDAKNAAAAIDQVAYLDGEEILELDKEPGIFLYHSVADLMKSEMRTGEILPEAIEVGD